MNARPGSGELVGRHDELELLGAPCLAGPGGIAVLSGEAGTGKTRLLAEVARRASAAGALVLRGHAVPGGGAFRPLAEALVRAAPSTLAADERLTPFRSVLARLLPAWPPGPVAGAHVVDPVVVLGEAVIELLGVIAEHRRCVLLLDDLHWADGDTLAVLEYLAGGLAGLPVRIVGAARTDESHLPGLAVLGRNPDVEVVALGRLEPAAVRALARSCAGGDLAVDVEDFLVAEADGLPLLVEELFAGLVETASVTRVGGGWRAAGPLRGRVPGWFAELVGHRLAALDPGHRAVVLSAAVLGRGAHWDLLSTVTGIDALTVGDALRAAVGVRVLSADPDGGGDLVWRHALTQDAVLVAVTAPERAALAARAAAALDVGDLLGARLALVADLHARGGAPARAAELMIAMAVEAADAGAPAAALGILERAVVLASGHGDLSMRIAVERVRVLALAARTQDALDVGDAVLARAVEPHRTALAVALARACVAAERFAEAGGYLGAVTDGADPRVLALAAHVALGTGELERALRTADAAVVAAEEAGLPEVVCEALEIAGRGRRRSDPAASREAFVRAEHTAERHGLVPWRIRALSELGVNDMIGAGDGASLRRAELLAVDAGMLGTATMLDLQQTALTIGVEGMVAGMVRAERCAERARRLGLAGPQAHALMFVARGRVFTDRSGEAGAVLDAAAALAPDPIHIEGERFHLRAYDAWLRGDDATAAAELDAGVAVIRQAGANPAPVWGEWALLRTVVDPSDAGPRTELRGSDVLVQAANVAALHYADAVVAAHCGRPEEAATHVAAADEILGRTHFHRHLWRAFLLNHAGVPGLPDPVGWLHEALAWLHGRGEVRMVHLCQERLRRLGEPVPRPGRDLEVVPPALRALGITGRELQVLRLIADGSSNPAIAARLQLSRRTVETHVGNLLAKTGATGRTALPRWLDP